MNEQEHISYVVLLLMILQGDEAVDSSEEGSVTAQKLIELHSAGEVAAIDSWLILEKHLENHLSDRFYEQ